MYEWTFHYLSTKQKRAINTISTNYIEELHGILKLEKSHNEWGTTSKCVGKYKHGVGAYLNAEGSSQIN